MTEPVAAPVAAPAPVAPATITIPAAAPVAAPAPVAPAPVAAAPAAPVTPAPLSIDTPAAPPAPVVPENVVVEYTPTGDTGLDLALSFVGQRGFGPDHPGIVAAQKGDFKPLEDALAALGDRAKGYKPYLAQAKSSYEATQAKSTASAASTRTAVLEAVGGEGAWAQIQAWAAANADPAEKVQVNAALAAGGLQATAMATSLAAMWKKSGAATVQPKAVTKPDTSAATVSTDALDPKAYGAAFAALYQKLGRKTHASPEMAALDARRAAFRG